MNSRPYPAVIVLVVAMVLAGCDSSDPAREPGATPTARDDGLTEPGSSLAADEIATVPLRDDAGEIELAVVEVARGSRNAVKGERRTPYYVRLQATSVAGDAYQFRADEYVYAYAEGELLLPIGVPLKIGPCERTYFGYRTPPGRTLETCLTFVVEPGGAPPDRVVYGFDGVAGTDSDQFVEWRVRAG